MKKLIIIFFFSIGIFTLFTSLAKAQLRDTDVVLSIVPQYPNPNQEVTATLGSHSVDLDKANITWSLNGEETSIGIGKKSFSFKMNTIELSTFLVVSINTIDGQSISKNMTITPTNVDLLYEGYDSYTPPFYKGKALVPSQGQFKVVAMPSINNQNGSINSNNLSYAWTKDDTPQPEASGWGNNYFIFSNSYLDKGNTVEVKVSDITGNTNAINKINLQTFTPKILFYENDPIFGTKWEKTLDDNFSINTNGETIDAEPYFFSPKDINDSSLTFDWSLNGQTIDTPDPKNILSIKPEAGQSGNAVIKVVVNNINTLFQSVTKQMTVNF